MREIKVDEEKPIRGFDELDFIRYCETNRRSILLMKRDGLSELEAKEKAAEWIKSDIEESRYLLPIEPSMNSVYRVYYRRHQDDNYSDYRLLNVVTKGILYNWLATYDVLADIIRDRFDRDCKSVVNFHPTRQHDIDLLQRDAQNSKIA